MASNRKETDAWLLGYSRILCWQLCLLLCRILPQLFINCGMVFGVVWASPERLNDVAVLIGIGAGVLVGIF